MEQIVNIVRRADSVALLCESLQIVMKRIEKFEIEFESEINPERSVGRCWKYAQDVVHDFHTAMVTSFYRTEWCEEGKAIIREIKRIFLVFISDVSYVLGTESGPIFLDGFDEPSFQSTVDVPPKLKLQNSANCARILRQSLEVIVSQVKQLMLRYEDDLENNRRGFQL